jgi:hypothetical protein
MFRQLAIFSLLRNPQCVTEHMLWRLLESGRLIMQTRLVPRLCSLCIC